MLRKLSDKKRFDFYSRFIGTKQSVLFETQKEDDFVEGFTTNYIRVKAKSEMNIENTVLEAKLENLEGVKPVFCKII